MHCAQPITIQKPEREDRADLIEMMIQLAKFEGYIKDFAVTEEALEKRFFVQKDFDILVAKINGHSVGMLVYYYLPFSYDLKPWVYIKELYVKPEVQSKGVGKKLVAALAKECIDNNCSKIRWDVLTTNVRAKKFYKSIGAKEDSSWSLFSMTEENIGFLAQESG